MFKQSKYNFVIEDSGSFLYYNALTNVIIPINEADKPILDKYFENIQLFEKKEPIIFNKFIKYGFLIGTDYDELQFLRFMNKKDIFGNRDFRLTINPTLDCNMNCWYCSVVTAGAMRSNVHMSDDMLKRVKLFIDKLAIMDRMDGIYLDWFGGEPLLYFDEVIYPIASHCKKQTITRKIKFTNFITTNGYLIEKYIDKFNEIALSNFQITIDGNEKRHDKIRQHFGNPSFAKILNNIILLCEKIVNANIILRINYDKQTLNNVTEIIHMIPVKMREKITISLNKVFQIDRVHSEENIKLKNVKKEFEIAGFKVNYWAFRPKTYHTCYSDRLNHAVINFDGNVYKCTARDYGEKMKAGFLNEKGCIDWNLPLISTMFAKAPFENEKCIQCNMLPICMGPCIQHAYENNNEGVKFMCLMEESEISLSSYIRSEAFNRSLV